MGSGDSPQKYGYRIQARLENRSSFTNVSWNIVHNVFSNNENWEKNSDFGTKESIDCMVTNGDNTSIFAACGDNNVHHIDTEYGKVKLAFTGHTDFIHSLSLV